MNVSLIPYELGVMHAVVDATTVTVVMSASWLHQLSPAQAALLIVSYDLLAFGMQPLLGACADRLAFLKTAVILGLALSAAGMALLPLSPAAAMITAGLGNALFHIGGGGITLGASGGGAKAPGIFVAPGTIGLALGLWMGRHAVYLPWPYYAALALCLAAAWFLREPQHPACEKGSPPSEKTLIAGLFLFSIAVRSFVGLAGLRNCPRSTFVLCLMTLAAFGGKALGGVLSDRLGWISVGVGALLLSAAPMAFGGPHPWIVAGGLFFFQMTMPVTLAAVARIFPRQPAFAFGLTALAFVAGSLPILTHTLKSWHRPDIFLALILSSALALFLGLRRVSNIFG